MRIQIRTQTRLAMRAVWESQWVDDREVAGGEERI